MVQLFTYQIQSSADSVTSAVISVNKKEKAHHAKNAKKVSTFRKINIADNA